MKSTARGYNPSTKKKINTKKVRKPIVILRKKKPSPPPPPVPKKDFLENIPFQFRKHVYRHIESIMPPIPWAVGIREEVTKRLIFLDEYTGKRLKVRKLIRWKLKTICKSEPYLKLVVAGGIRHGFDGYTEPIQKKHQKAARNFLSKMKLKKKNLARNSRKNHNLKKVM